MVEGSIPSAATKRALHLSGVDSYRYRRCAFDSWDEQMPCWGPVCTTDVMQLEEGDFFLNTCEGHRLMFSKGPYIVKREE